jgi:hypothetical protein
MRIGASAPWPIQPVNGHPDALTGYPAALPIDGADSRPVPHRGGSLRQRVHDRTGPNPVGPCWVRSRLANGGQEWSSTVRRNRRWLDLQPPDLGRGRGDVEFESPPPRGFRGLRPFAAEAGGRPVVPESSAPVSPRSARSSFTVAACLLPDGLALGDRGAKPGPRTGLTCDFSWWAWQGLNLRLLPCEIFTTH